MSVKERIILHLCAKTGSDSQNYKDAGYKVILITEKEDVRLLKPIPNVYGIIANPPCTDLSGSGARWWKGKGQEALFKALVQLEDGDLLACLLGDQKPEVAALAGLISKIRHTGLSAFSHPHDG